MNDATSKKLENLWREFGVRVRRRREELELSQEEIASRIGMKRQQWLRIEQGASTKRATVLRIADALKLDPDLVLEWAGFRTVIKPGLIDNPVRMHPPTVISKDVRVLDDALLFYFHRLTDEQKPEALEAMIRFYRERVGQMPAKSEEPAPLPDAARAAVTPNSLDPYALTELGYVEPADDEQEHKPEAEPPRIQGRSNEKKKERA